MLLHKDTYKTQQNSYNNLILYMAASRHAGGSGHSWNKRIFVQPHPLPTKKPQKHIKLPSYESEERQQMKCE